MMVRPTSENFDIKHVLDDVSATHAVMQRNVRATPTSSDLTRLLDDVAVAHATMQYEAFRLQKERRHLSRVRAWSGWTGLVLCAAYAALAMTSYEPQTVVFNAVLAVTWGGIAVLNFWRYS